MVRKESSLKSILIGAITGILIGIIVFFIGLGLTFDEWYFSSIGLPFGFGEYIGSFLGFEGWGRIVPYFFGGSIVYALLGTLIGFLVGKLIEFKKSKK